MGAGASLSDVALLLMLARREEGRTCAEIGREVGVGPGSVSRILCDIDYQTEPSRHDGTEPAGWWREGLRKQVGA